MNNKNLQGIKKFKFFEVEKPEEPEAGQKFLGYSLNEVTISSFKFYNKFYYVSGKLKSDKRTDNTKLFRILKVHSNGKILEEYIPFTDSIIDFYLINNEGKPYIVALGTDLRNKDDKSEAQIEIKGNAKEHIEKIIVKPSPNTIPSIKFFDLTNLQIEVEEKNEIKEEKNEIKIENKNENKEPKELGVLKPNDVLYLIKVTI